MDPSGAEAHDNAIDEQVKLRASLEKKPLSDFTVKELPMLNRVMECEAYADDIAHFRRKFKL